MTGWHIVVMHALTLAAFGVLMLYRDAPPVAVDLPPPLQPASVTLNINPPSVVYVTPPPLPDRNPKRMH